MVDHSVYCTLNGERTPEYALVSSVATILTLVWPIGMPIFLFFNMWRVRSKIHARDEDTLKLFDFVIGDYSQEYWYWELVELSVSTHECWYFVGCCALCSLWVTRC